MELLQKVQTLTEKLCIKSRGVKMIYIPSLHTSSITKFSDNLLLI